MKISHLLDFNSVYAKGKKSVELVSSKDLVGIEMELEDIPTHSSEYYNILPKKQWTSVNEDSIRNGQELILTKPLSGTVLIRALKSYYKFIEDFQQTFKRYPTLSERCSLHVHIDVRDFTVEQVMDMSYLYILYEKIFFQLLKPSRSKNNYCQVLTETNFSFIMNSLKGYHDSLSDYKYSIQSKCDKYSSMNLTSLPKYGSLEFRGHPGTHSYDEALLWINILLSLKNFVREYKGILTPLYLKGLSPHMFTETVFGNLSGYIINTNHFYKNFTEGKSWVISSMLQDELKETTIKQIIDKDKPTTLLTNYMKVKQCVEM